MGVGLTAIPKGMELPPNPRAPRKARVVATPGVIGQKSAEATVVSLPADEGPNLVARGSRLGLRIGVEARPGQPGAGNEVHNQPWTFNGSWTRTQPTRLKGSERRIILVGYRLFACFPTGNRPVRTRMLGGVGAEG
jgi:hypothetical protein